MKRIAVLFLILIVSFAFAQYEDFDLSKYKLPDLTTRSFDVELYANDNYTHIWDNSDPLDPGENSSTYLRNSIDFSFQVNRNHSKFQRVLDLNTYFYDYYQYSKQEIRDNTESQFSQTLSADVLNRQFFNSNIFLETALNSEFSYGFNRQETIYSNGINNYEYNYNTYNTYLILPLKIGKGRIERVDDARRAIYILETLEKENRIKHLDSDAEIIEFAEKISDIRAARVYDKRIGHMEDIQSLDEFLRSKEYVTNPDAVYFTNLYDMWDYGYNKARYSGRQIAFKVQPGTQIIKTRNLTNNTLTQNRIYTFDAGLDYSNETPVNLYWQQSLNMFAYAGTYNIKHTTLIDTVGQISNGINYRLGAEYELSYFPDTRSKYSFLASLNYANILGEYDQDRVLVNKGGHYLYGRLGTSYTYYFSPRLSLVANLQIITYWTNSENSISANFNYDDAYGYRAGSSTQPVDRAIMNPYGSIRVYYAIF